MESQADDSNHSVGNCETAAKELVAKKHRRFQRIKAKAGHLR